MEHLVSNELIARLERLERENRRLRVSGLALPVLALICLIGPALARAGGSVSPRVEAQQFILRDEAGRVRGMLGMDEGRPRLVLRDEKGAVLVEIDGQPHTLPAGR
jgi:hypothetical protein